MYITLFYGNINLTYAVVTVIFDPPAAPAPRTKSPFLSVNTVGHIDDIGRFPGFM